MTLRSISIEDLLTWAYRDQMVHVASRVEMVALQPSRGPCGYGNGFKLEVVDASAPVSFTASSDAFAVHDAVRVLAPVDARIPAETFGAVGPTLHESALPSVDPSFTVDRRRLVQFCAIDGQRPDWIPDPVIAVERGPTIYSRHKGSGQIKRDARGLPIVSLCSVQFVGDMPWEIERARITYRLWVQTLALLRDSLVLQRHVLTDELPMAEPWKQMALPLEQGAGRWA